MKKTDFRKIDAVNVCLVTLIRKLKRFIKKRFHCYPSILIVPESSGLNARTLEEEEEEEEEGEKKNSLVRKFKILKYAKLVHCIAVYMTKFNNIGTMF